MPDEKPQASCCMTNCGGKCGICAPPSSRAPEEGSLCPDCGSRLNPYGVCWTCTATPLPSPPEEPPTHELKVWPEPFRATLAGEKHHEYRRADRDFRGGDTLRLREYEPCLECNGSQRIWANGDKDDCHCTATANPGGKYTGRETRRRISYITRCPEWGGAAGFVVLSLGPVSRVPSGAAGEEETVVNEDAAASKLLLQQFIRAHRSTGCKVLTFGANCPCELCELDRFEAALLTAFRALQEENRETRRELAEALRTLRDDGSDDLVGLSLVWIGGDEMHDRFYAWYKPEQWMGMHRAASAFLQQELDALKASVRALQERAERGEQLAGALKADTERVDTEGRRVGIEMGCDTPHWMAEEILGLRAQVSSLSSRLREMDSDPDPKGDWIVYFNENQKRWVVSNLYERTKDYRFEALSHARAVCAALCRVASRSAAPPKEETT